MRNLACAGFTLRGDAGLTIATTIRHDSIGINERSPLMLHWRPLVITLAIGLLCLFAALGGAVHWAAQVASSS